jgi:hypothetical protein
MPHDPDAFAEMVVLTVKAALAPVLADVKFLQAQIAGWDARWSDLGALRERVAVVEAKELPTVAEPPEPVDLTPVLERMAAAEARLDVLGDVRDRVVEMQSKSVPVTVVAPEPVRVDLTPIMERLASADTRLARLAGLETTVGELRDSVLMIKAKADTVPEPVPSGPSEADLELHIKSALEPITRDMAGLSERIAVLDARAQIPGPAGKDGQNGKDGAPGKDGEPGRDGLAGLSFEGVYQEGKSYDKGNLVTWAGSSWHCNEPTTTKPGDGSKDWTLMVKRGRDGKDGQDAKTTPVVSVGRPS